VKEKLREYALIAEIISSMAVVITLVILILQIRENTDTVRVAAFQDIVSGLNEWRDGISSNPHKTALFVDITINHKLPEEGTSDYQVLQMTLESIYSNWESAYFAYQSGIIGDQQWSRVGRNICLGRDYFLWDENLKKNIYLRLTDDFAGYMDRQECLDNATTL
jgi:hypothetical protein